jgi:glycosyltransferase involved in cell wall biosynthesis
MAEHLHTNAQSPDSPTTPAASPRRVRVCILQPLMPHYRVPVFDLLARQPGIELSVWSDHKPQGSIHPAPGTGNFETVHTPFKYLGPVYWQPMQVTAAKAAAGGRFDVVIYSWNSRLVHLRRALNICRRAGVPTLLWGHGIGVGGRNSFLRRWLRNGMIHKAAGCITYNHIIARRLAEQGIDPDRIFVALNALDQAPIRHARDHWLARPDELARFRVERGVTGRNMVMFISRLEPNKRVDLLIEAFAIVARQQPQTKLAIIGRGPQETALRAQAARAGIAERVIFAGAVYEETDLAPWFLSSACLAYPVAIGLSILHAFGYGLPVVTSDNIAWHNPEIESLKPGENGLLYRDGDVNDFAVKILECLRDQALRQRMAESALATVREPDGFCVLRMVRGFTDAISFALNNRSIS